MDKTIQYRNLVKKILTKHAKLVTSQCTPEMETILSLDEEHDQYLWLQMGWQKYHRVHGITLHLRLHNGKIWIEQDWTENGIANDLLEAGVPHLDIVLGFRHPERRPLTEFAVA
ncbi:XisI protein [Candidatus Parabeggiatoa sp. HSG14]|uniref:XisI protein n=1 Tax=Candidatus Parabeggiatoa sp. HSG14 TaxID=3055593 RepID=UPI0025A79C5E|nr:XisI protein [Thiotrichales bacterium HSG14]